MFDPATYLKFGLNGVALAVIYFSHRAIQSAVAADATSRRELLRTARFYLVAGVTILVVASATELIKPIVVPKPAHIALNRSPRDFPRGVRSPVLIHGTDKAIELLGDPTPLDVSTGESISIQVDDLTQEIDRERLLLGRRTQEALAKETLGEQGGFDNVH